MFLPPMLLTKREDPFDDPRYLFEPKIDGHRLLLSVLNGRPILHTRHETLCTAQYPELHDVPLLDASDAVLDGEVARVDPATGAVDFESLMERFQLKQARKIHEAAASWPVHYFVFDILRYKGEDLRAWPLARHKELLHEVLRPNAYFSNVMSVEGTGKALFDVIKSRQLEGTVAKRSNSVYVGRRDPRWIKIINYTYAEVAIAGYRREEFGWLAHYEGRPAGLIEFAVPSAHKKAFYGVAKQLVTGQDKDFVYLEPLLRVQVRFRNWTRRGMLRSPEFVKFVV
ncbi:DNA ligase-1 [Cohnella sp. OV330]|uniref:ATP-dependent DNA ligase n=1 Tax=Cohnella sp. OV330 TaxID=1855288 RepID=UPI0008E95DB2|nr:ATP-dependent DNA ligase [Cohnella sp. OV330]SFA91872.1 DNA ligase-1 [Cohnella sp. OV330]